MKTKTKSYMARAGFTMMEMVLVLAIIALLMGVAIKGMGVFLDKGKETRARADIVRKKIEKRMFEEYPDKWMPLYSQVTFSHIPYSEAWAAGQKQDRIMDKIMQRSDIANNWDSEDVRKEILALLEH